MGSLDQGARNVVTTCLAVKRGERVVLVTDGSTRDIGDAIERHARAATDAVERFDLDDLGARPLKEVPKALAEAASRADVTVWAAASVKGELPARMEFRKYIRGRARHGHMPGVTRVLMEEGMNADYDAVEALTLKVFERAKRARTARVTNPNGTDFSVEFKSDWKWLADTGKFHRRGDWGNLPAGETYTAPYRMNGRVVTNLLGDFFSEKYGELVPPVRFDVRDSWVDLESIAGGTPEVVAEFRAYLQTGPNSARAGEFALGTNLGLTRLVGNLLQDEKIVGVHVAFGNPYPEETGAPWHEKTHVDCVILETDVWLDGERVQQAGRYVL
ncbi:MAG TPA: aminopeptidase [Candidatus Thermoplasmatota archaeon]|nr:aminopeptidase [Candidatus Thermoplasmatota archaeon]